VPSSNQQRCTSSSSIRTFRHNSAISPTAWQRSRLPPIYQEKVRVIFDGVDTSLWRPQPDCPRRIGKLTFPPEMRLVTYAARGFESMRGFDIFMKVAKRLGDR
jgi:glycosyltransferase involved in cell wall biosynthesis